MSVPSRVHWPSFPTAGSGRTAICAAVGFYVDPDGGNDAAIATATVRVSAPGSRLPITGGNTYRILFSATTLAVFGAVLVLFGRRREGGFRGA